MERVGGGDALPISDWPPGGFGALAAGVLRVDLTETFSRLPL